MSQTFYSSPWGAARENASSQPDFEEELMQEIARNGAKNLASGAVTPEQAAANAKKLGLLPGKPRARVANPAARIAATPVRPSTPTPVMPVDPLSPAANPLQEQEEKLLEEFKHRLENSRQKQADFTPEEMQTKYEQAMASPAVQEQLGGIRKQQDLLAMVMNQPTQLDISPLLALTDAWTGSHMTQSYKGPESLQAKRDKILGYAQKLQDDRRDVSKSVMEAIKAQKSGTNIFKDLQDSRIYDEFHQKLKDLRELQAKGRGQTDQEIRWGDALQNKIRQDKDIQKATEQLSGVHTAKQLLLSGKSVADEAFKIAFTRAMGDSHISNVDIAKKNGSTDALDRLEQAWNTVSTGKFTEENRASYLKALEDLEKIANWKKEARRSYWEKQAQTTYKFNPDKAKGLVRDGLEVESAGPSYNVSNDPEVKRAQAKAAGKTPTPAPNGATPQPGMKRVREKLTGKTGWMPEEKFKTLQDRFEEIK